jgi:hypothetical protein
MAVVQIPNLPAAISLTGAEELEIVQAGESKRTTSQAIANLAPDMTFPGYWASYYSTVSQTNPVGGAVNKVTFNNSTGNYGISVASNTQITVSNAGVYSIYFTAEVDKNDGGADQVDFWLMKNNSNLTATNRRATLSAAGEKTPVSVSYIQSLNAGDYLEIAWSSADIDLLLYAEAAAGSLPATPSILMNIQLVREL